LQCSCLTAALLHCCFSQVMQEWDGMRWNEKNSMMRMAPWSFHKTYL
jgi:hypothetical protein